MVETTAGWGVIEAKVGASEHPTLLLGAVRGRVRGASGHQDRDRDSDYGPAAVKFYAPRCIHGTTPTR